MSHEKRSRELKILDIILPFFVELSTSVGGDEFALIVCRHLQAMKDQAIEDRWIASFVDIWKYRHPEEVSLSNDELLRALKSVDEHFSQRIKATSISLIANNHPAAKFKVVNGGLSEKPDIPYVNLNPGLQAHKFSDF